MTKVVTITGCLGFIGSYITSTCLEKGWQVFGVDSCTYAANTKLLNEFNDYKNFRFSSTNICKLNSIYDCDYIINTAAETHVDNSIACSDEFVRSNIDGVHNLLRLIQTRHRFKMPMLVHFSTDEVYGDIMSGSFTENQLMQPSNPYSATKASADMLITAWYRTFGVPYLIVRPTNNYGIGQYIEKFIPKTVQYLTLGRPVPLHENGTPRRTWLHVQDTADALMFLLEKGCQNEIFNISGNHEDSNLNVFKKILKCFGYNPNLYQDYADFSVQRPGQDVRYSIDDTKIRRLGWKNIRVFDDELPDIVDYHKQRFIW
jgi:dTDP-glucose 4,6-dehydratase